MAKYEKLTEKSKVEFPSDFLEFQGSRQKYIYNTFLDCMSIMHKKVGNFTDNPIFFGRSGAYVLLSLLFEFGFPKLEVSEAREPIEHKDAVKIFLGLPNIIDFIEKNEFIDIGDVSDMLYSRYFKNKNKKLIRDNRCSWAHKNISDNDFDFFEKVFFRDFTKLSFVKSLDINHISSNVFAADIKSKSEKTKFKIYWCNKILEELEKRQNDENAKFDDVLSELELVWSSTEERHNITTKDGIKVCESLRKKPEKISDASEDITKNRDRQKNKGRYYLVNKENKIYFYLNGLHNEDKKAWKCCLKSVVSRFSSYITQSFDREKKRYIPPKDEPSQYEKYSTCKNACTARILDFAKQEEIYKIKSSENKIQELYEKKDLKGYHDNNPLVKLINRGFSGDDIVDLKRYLDARWAYKKGTKSFGKFSYKIFIEDNSYTMPSNINKLISSHYDYKQPLCFNVDGYDIKTDVFGKFRKAAKISVKPLTLMIDFYFDEEKNIYIIQDNEKNNGGKWSYALYALPGSENKKSSTALYIGYDYDHYGDYLSCLDPDGNVLDTRFIPFYNKSPNKRRKQTFHIPSNYISVFKKYGITTTKKYSVDQIIDLSCGVSRVMKKKEDEKVSKNDKKELFRKKKVSKNDKKELFRKIDALVRAPYISRDNSYKTVKMWDCVRSTYQSYCKIFDIPYDEENYYKRKKDNLKKYLAGTRASRIVNYVDEMTQKIKCESDDMTIVLCTEKLNDLMKRSSHKNKSFNRNQSYQSIITTLFPQIEADVVKYNNDIKKKNKIRKIEVGAYETSQKEGYLRGKEYNIQKIIDKKYKDELSENVRKEFYDEKKNVWDDPYSKKNIKRENLAKDDSIIVSSTDGGNLLAQPFAEPSQHGFCVLCKENKKHVDFYAAKQIAKKGIEEEKQGVRKNQKKK